jgi:hypothetical protein
MASAMVKFISPSCAFEWRFAQSAIQLNHILSIIDIDDGMVWIFSIPI